MSLSRSPSPRAEGGWSSPGLTANFDTVSGRSSPRKTLPGLQAIGSSTGSGSGSGSSSGGGGVTWASAKARSNEVNKYPPFSTTRSNGFFSRHARSISNSLPRWALGGGGSSSRRDFSDREKLQRGRWSPNHDTWLGRLRTFLASMTRRMKMRILIVLALVLGVIVFYASPLHHIYRRTSWLGGGSKYVIVLAANVGGGVMDWKGPREWAIERDSVKNKKRYASKWGYDLEIVDMSTKKRYAHEWRESWEKVDTMRNCMRKYPKAEWFWWLDLNTFIMEPSLSLQTHVFDSLQSHVYRNINVYNPLNITHPFAEPYLDGPSAAAEGDGKLSSIDLLVPQDCAGFNLGSFFLRRSAWTDRLLDIWWDPVLYEQKHMEWEHKEQDALEHLYAAHPWVRAHTAFVPQRLINSFPKGACGDGPSDDGNGGAAMGDQIHYSERDRDFLVNMAGCEWGRDCWGEMYNFRELSNRLNRSRWEKFKDGVSDRWKNFREGRKKDKDKDKKDDKDEKKD